MLQANDGVAVNLKDSFYVGGTSFSRWSWYVVIDDDDVLNERATDVSVRFTIFLGKDRRSPYIGADSCRYQTIC